MRAGHDLTFAMGGLKWVGSFVAYPREDGGCWSCDHSLGARRVRARIWALLSGAIEKNHIQTLCIAAFQRSDNFCKHRVKTLKIDKCCSFH